MLTMDVDDATRRAAAAPEAVLIAIDQLSKTYVSASGATVHALSRISLHIKPGEFVCVVGPSGCGKSTLLRLLAGLDSYSDGRLLLDGEPVAGPSRKVGVVFQAANLLPWMTVRDNVGLPLRVGGKHAPAGDRIERLLAVTGLGDFGDKYPYELSGGMQQRAGICRALARDPEILLMDEPFGALDALTRERLNLELQRIWQENRKTVLLITHSISEAIFLADRVIVMSARPGRILADLHVPIPRQRSFDDIVLHPDYARLAREVRGLLNAQEHGHD
ncbi:MULTISPECIES: ABC transporter ATP-binding protein [unclassified Bradyrhizobium]|uniref:ABC transporter ATP-binding protein n=1 Tax=unclassified Bradyrhizobium TaxID=2631580 RepID=UPI0028EC3F00|nr:MULTISPECIES: ABC transporter ATP-binding protein [unclassified Bradyrhizobium]